jgi:hypothetical protein
MRHITRFVPGEAMNNLGVAYFELGRHQDALILREKTLELRQRVLPDNHFQIGLYPLRS